MPSPQEIADRSLRKRQVEALERIADALEAQSRATASMMGTFSTVALSVSQPADDRYPSCSETEDEGR